MFAYVGLLIVLTVCTLHVQTRADIGSSVADMSEHRAGE